ncbi:MAG TPA: hypothetical protein VMK16_11475 [Acidimicrobiales bacterium]|nr:hypothetical protein [Acidimicrobiales bacterium]
MSDHHVPDEDIDRVLDGDELGADAGQAMEATAALIRRASSQGTAAELGAADATVARFIELVSEPSEPTNLRRPRSIPLPAKAAAIVVAATLWSTGVAAAATGHLPEGLQRAVSNTASHVGITFPNPDDEQSLTTNGNNDDQGEDEDASATTTVTSGATSSSPTSSSPTSSSTAGADDSSSAPTTASTIGGTSTATADVSTTAASAAARGRGPDVTGPAGNGLCNAYLKAIEKGHPKNPDAPPWRNLLAAADAACNGQISASTTVQAASGTSSTTTPTTTSTTSRSSTTTVTTVAAANGEGNGNGGGNGHGGDVQGGDSQGTDTQGGGSQGGNGHGGGHGDNGQGDNGQGDGHGGNGG